MKIQFDTTNKTIKIEEKVNLNELFDALNKMFPNNEWKEFTLEMNTTINWNPNPIIVQPFNQPYTNPYPYPQYPWYAPITYCNDDSINNSKFNITTSNPTLTINTTNMANVGNNSTYAIPNPITDFYITPIGNNDWNVTLLKDSQQSFKLSDGIFDVEVK